MSSVPQFTVSDFGPGGIFDGTITNPSAVYIVLALTGPTNEDCPLRGFKCLGVFTSLDAANDCAKDAKTFEIDEVFPALAVQVQKHIPK